MDRSKELYIAIKQAANLANWRLSLFFSPEPPRRAPLQPLKHRERGVGGERVLPRYGKKIHRGPAARLARSGSIQPEKKEGCRSGLCVAAGGERKGEKGNVQGWC